MNSKLPNKILEDSIISLSSGESDVNLLEPDLGLDLEEDLDITKPYSIIDELMDGPPTHYQHSQNYLHQYKHSMTTTTFTIFSMVSHLLSTMTTTTTHSTINTASSTPQHVTMTHDKTQH